MIVGPESANPGLPSSDPVPIDADHFGIASPETKESEIYRNVRHILREWMAAPLPDKPDAGLAEQFDAVTAAVTAVGDRLLNASGGAAIPVELIDAEIQNRISRLRRARFFVGFDGLQESTALARAVTEGDLRAGSAKARAEALAWSTRVLAAKDLAQAKASLDKARQLGNSDTAKVAGAICTAFDGDTASALGELSKISTAQSRSAAFIVVANRDGAAAALKWLTDSGLALHDLDSDGKFFALQKMMETERWANALTVLDNLAASDLAETPALSYLAANVHLAQTVVPELRPSLRFGLPSDPRAFPLADDKTSLEHRRKAEEFFRLASDSTRSLGFERPANEAADLALWLRLRDLETQDLHISNWAIVCAIPVRVCGVCRSRSASVSRLT